MSIAVCVGGNKQISANRLGVSLARRLQSSGKEVLLCAAKGSIKQTGPVVLKEFIAAATAKVWASAFVKNNVEEVVSLMNLRACEAAVEAHIPFIYVEYDGFKEDKPSKTKKALLKKAKKVIILCDGEKPVSKRTYTGIPVVRTTVPALGVEHGSWGRPESFKKQNNIVAIGKLTKENNFETLLDCWAKLAPLHPSWHLTIVGDGASKANLNRLIAKHYLQASAEIASAAAGIEPFLAQADIFAYTASKAARADELLDAMASKLPAVALDSALARELITDCVNGVLAADEAAFVHALDALMVDWGYRVGLAVCAGQERDKKPLKEFVRVVWENL